MLFGALWSIARIRGGSTGSSEPGAPPSQQAQHCQAPLQWPPSLPFPELLERHLALLLVWHLVQGTVEGHLRLE